MFWWLSSYIFHFFICDLFSCLIFCVFVLIMLRRMFDLPISLVLLDINSMFLFLSLYFQHFFYISLTSVFLSNSFPNSSHLCHFIWCVLCLLHQPFRFSDLCFSFFCFSLFILISWRTLTARTSTDSDSDNSQPIKASTTTTTATNAATVGASKSNASKRASIDKIANEEKGSNCLFCGMKKLRESYKSYKSYYWNLRSRRYENK